MSSICSTVIAQTLEWQQSISAQYAGPQPIIATPDGGYLIASPGVRVIRFTKISKDGKSLWQKTVASSNGAMTTLIATHDNGYLIGGNFNNNYWVLKINQNWAKVWEKTFGGDSTETLSSLIADENGNFLLGGTSYSGKSGDKTQPRKGYSDYWIVKINKNGQKLWDNSFGGVIRPALTYYYGPDGEPQADTITTGHSYFKTMLATPDGNYVLGGSTNSFAGNDNTSSNPITEEYPTWSSWDNWIIKIDPAGRKIWDKAYGTGSYVPAFATMILTPDKGLLLGATEYYDNNNSEFGSYYAVSKISNTGDFLWRNSYGSPVGFNKELTTLLNTPDGGYLIGGQSSDDGSEWGDKSEPSRGLDDYWVIKVTSQGNRVWDKTIGGDGHDNLTTLFTTPNNGYLLAGLSFSEISGDKTVDLKDTTDFWLVKIKENNPLTTTWDLRYGAPGNENLTTLIETPDGGFLAGGYTNSDVSGDKAQLSQGKNDYWVVKSDKYNRKIWEYRYGGTQDDYLNRILRTKDGGYLLAGSSRSGIGGDKTQASRGDRDYWIVKINNAGEKQWDKRFGGSGYDELKKVIQLTTGEFILAGYSNSPASGDKSQGSQGGTDFWLVKVSATGTKIWDKRYGGNLNETLTGIVETADKGYLLGGSSVSGKSGDKSQVSQGGSDFWLIRVDKNGEKIWDKTYGGGGQDEAYALGRNGKEFFISGQSDSPAGGDKTRGTQGGLDFWFLKLTSTGEKVWDKRFGGSQNDELRASIQTQDGGYLLAGKSFSGKSGNKTQESRGDSDYWIVKTDKDGMYQWDKRFGGSGAEELRVVTQTPDGGLLLGGKSDSGVSGDRTQFSQGGMDYWLVKVALEAKAIVATRKSDLSEKTSTQTEQIILKISPNPVFNKTMVSFALPQTQMAAVKVYNSQGHEVAILFQQEVKANKNYQVEWQTSNNTSGIYILQLQTPVKHLQQKLLLIK
ncbi:T9SS type A sorting domain-containing protein [Adhaeribacter swui]|uniref:T9SS type A sorting domain-containing protein n=1 Tax=Adhaeribacter swui TaxID=2086471 RepID=A0A7G7G7C7_9BACT|nr:T9SS type A sorting domain-containing protein [Adhaeribacter swui]QNF33061.1 T9SS type A sorting domain-containing protein [Adhaeribacter swui]